MACTSSEHKSVVPVLSFFLGLSLGLLGLLIYRARLSQKLRRLTRVYDPREIGVGFSVTSQVTRMIQQYQQRCQALEQSIDSWRQIVNAAPIGYLQVDDENQLTWCNPQALKLLNIQNFDDASPRLLLELVRSYDLDSLIEQARATQKRCTREWTLYPVSVDVANVRTPESRPLRGSAFPLINDQVGVILENREEAAMLAQQRDRWTSDVAHELRTPLTSIRLVAETLQSRLEPPLRQWIDRLLKEVIRLSTLVQEILDLSQLEAAKTRPLKLTKVDLPQLIQSAWLSLEPIARSKAITLTYHGPEQLLIQADENRLHRVLINLLDNGIKFTLPERPIAIHVSLQNATATQPRCVQLDIVDGGAGFPESDLPLIFERFYRADPSRTRQTANESQPAPLPQTVGAAAHSLPTPNMPVQPFQPSSGSGLGLAIVRQIVELHHGTVTAQNHPEGGAWIQIKLPQQQN